MAERWLPIPGREDYMVSDMGRVASRNRVLTDSLGRRSHKKGKVLKAKVDRDGHKTIRFGLYEPQVYVHQLVLLAFVGPKPFKDAEVLHGNGDPGDNRLSNLRYGTRSENSLDALKHGTHTSVTRRKNPSTKSYEHLPGQTRRVTATKIKANKNLLGQEGAAQYDLRRRRKSQRRATGGKNDNEDLT